MYEILLLVIMVGFWIALKPKFDMWAEIRSYGFYPAIGDAWEWHRADGVKLSVSTLPIGTKEYAQATGKCSKVSTESYVVFKPPGTTHFIYQYKKKMVNEILKEAT